MKTPATPAVKANKPLVTRKPLNTISLKASLNSTAPTAQAQAKPSGASQAPVSNLFVDPTWKSTYTQEQLRDVWLKFGRSIEQKNARFASILVSHVPTLKEGNVIELELKNATQETEIKTNRSNLLQHLRHHLQNATIMLETKLVLDKKNEGVAYTSADKAKVMLKKNPMLLELTKKFNLDVE